VSAPRGVLVLSHGTPGSRDEVEAFYTRIRHGHPPTPELLADLQRRYDAIGGLSPLTARTAEQVDGLARALAARAADGYVVEGGTKYATPTIEDAVERLVRAGADEVVGVVLSPLRAPMTTDQYHERALDAIGGRTGYRSVWSWWDAPGFADLVAARVRDAVAGCATEPLVLFTAHSLPARVVTDGDYPGELAAAAAAVAAAAGVRGHLVCWQSAGRTADAWLGPDLLDVLRGLDPATADVVVCPVGFVSDHLEVLFDVDVEAVAVAAPRGVTVHRTASLNADPRFLDVLAGVVAAAS
jgi:ferrochelatase